MPKKNDKKSVKPKVEIVDHKKNNTLDINSEVANIFNKQKN